MSEMKKKRGGRKQVADMSLLRQVEYYTNKLKEMDDEREALAKSIPEPVRELMAVVAKAQKAVESKPRQSVVEADTKPQSAVETKPPAAPPKPNGKGASNGAAAHS